MKTLMTGLLATSLLIGCSQTKQLEEMHDTTAHMDHTMDHMDGSMDKLGTKTGDMDGKLGKVSSTMQDLHKDTADMGATLGDVSSTMKDLKASTETNLIDMKTSTGGICHGSSQALPFQARAAGALVQLDTAKTAPDKIGWAVAYIEAFDFQAWPLCKPSPSEIDHMLENATQEFFETLQRYDSGNASPDAFVDKATSEKTGQDLTFKMISVALGYVSRHQLDNHDKNPSAPVFTMYNLIKDSLLAGQRLERGEITLKDIKGYQYYVLLNQALAIKLLQANQSTSISIVANFAKAELQKDPASLLGGISDRLLTGFTHTAYAWKFNVDKWNQVQLDQYGKFLEAALQTRILLIKLNVAPELDVNLVASVKGMTPVVTEKRSLTATAVRQKFVSDLVAIQKAL